MKKSILLLKRAVFCMALFAFIANKGLAQTVPYICVGGNNVLVSGDAKFPIWLPAGTTVGVGSAVSSVSIIEYNVVAGPTTSGVAQNELQFSQVRNITTSCPGVSGVSGTVWKIEGVQLATAAFNAGTTVTGPQGVSGVPGVTGATGGSGATGPTGLTGASGGSGVSGRDAFTTTTTGYTQPSVGGTVTVNVGSTSWMAVGQAVYVAGSGGYYTVSSISSSTAAVLTYVGGGSTGSVGTTGSAVSPSGVQGISGISGATGAVGATGPSGATGGSGSTGSVGATGPSGATGASGATGVSGPTGPSGTAGSVGATGPSGATGGSGATGAVGATGATGASGAGGKSFEVPYWQRFESISTSDWDCVTPSNYVQSQVGSYNYENDYETTAGAAWTPAAMANNGSHIMASAGTFVKFTGWVYSESTGSGTVTLKVYKFTPTSGSATMPTGSLMATATATISNTTALFSLSITPGTPVAVAAGDVIIVVLNSSKTSAYYDVTGSLEFTLN